MKNSQLDDEEANKSSCSSFSDEDFESFSCSSDDSTECSVDSDSNSLVTLSENFDSCVDQPGVSATNSSDLDNNSILVASETHPFRRNSPSTPQNFTVEYTYDTKFTYVFHLLPLD